MSPCPRALNLMSSSTSQKYLATTIQYLIWEPKTVTAIVGMRQKQAEDPTKYQAGYITYISCWRRYQ